MQDLFIMPLMAVLIGYRMRFFIKKSNSNNIQFLNYRKKDLLKKVRLMEAILIMFVLIVLVFDIRIDEIEAPSNIMFFYNLLNMIWVPSILIITYYINDFYVENDIVIYPFSRRIYLNEITAVSKEIHDDDSTELYIYKNSTKYHLNIYGENKLRFRELLSCYISF